MSHTLGVRPSLSQAPSTCACINQHRRESVSGIQRGLACQLHAIACTHSCWLYDTQLAHAHPHACSPTQTANKHPHTPGRRQLPLPSSCRSALPASSCLVLGLRLLLAAPFAALHFGWLQQPGCNNGHQTVWQQSGRRDGATKQDTHATRSVKVVIVCCVWVPPVAVWLLHGFGCASNTPDPLC